MLILYFIRLAFALNVIIVFKVEQQQEVDLLLPADYRRRFLDRLDVDEVREGRPHPQQQHCRQSTQSQT